MWRWEIHTHSPLVITVNREQAAMLLGMTVPMVSKRILQGELPVISTGQPALVEVRALQEYLYRYGYQQPHVIAHVYSTIMPVVLGSVAPVGTTTVIQHYP